MINPQIALRQNCIIQINYPRLFRNAECGVLRDFLSRGFEVEEVVSVEIDRVAGSAVVHLHPNCRAGWKVLLRLAAKYEESRMQVVSPRQCPYFVLQEEGSRTVYSRAPKVAAGIRRYCYRGLSWIFFGLSIVGVWAPLVPTTPFVILSSYYALLSSPELNECLLRSRLFGRILNDWHLHRAMRRSTRRRVLIFMVVVLTVTFGISRPTGSSLPIALLVSLFSFGFVLRMPTVEDEIELAGRTDKPVFLSCQPSIGTSPDFG